jgi:hypothetical protein
LRRHPHSYTGADLPGDLDVPVGSLRIEGMITGGLLKEQLHALPGNVSGLGRVVFASHSLDSIVGDIKPIPISLILKKGIAFNLIIC